MGYKCEYLYELGPSFRNNVQSLIEENTKLEGIFWVLFYDFQDDIHVIPVDTDGNNFDNHLYSSMCSCKPVLKKSEKEDVRFQFIHNLRQYKESK